MLTINNVLDNETIEGLIKIADFETTHFLCPGVPKYQTYNNMHLKYSSDLIFQTFLKRIDEILDEEIDTKLEMSSCWFNICRKDSEFEFHTHFKSMATAVLFLKNCTGHGTLFKLDNSILQLIIKDNDIVIFNPEMIHSIPEWHGEDRYSIAMNFIPKVT